MKYYVIVHDGTRERRIYHRNGAPRWARRDWLGRKNKAAFTRDQVTRAKKWALAKPGVRFVRSVEVNPYPSLTGDLDCGADLLKRLERVAQDAGERLHVNSGGRTYDEQAALYAKNMYPNGTRRPGRPLTARPGTSRHETHAAADVVLQRNRGINIGDLAKTRIAMKRHGLCLPVVGEKWHVEVGNDWRA